MTLPARFSLAVSLGLSLLPTAYGGASEPPERPASHRPVEPSSLSIRLSNQEMAESIAARLRQSGVLQHYDVDIRFRDGAAELTGSVGDAGQRDRVLHLVQSVPGVERVVDHRAYPVLSCPCKREAFPRHYRRCRAPIPYRQAHRLPRLLVPRRPAVRLRKRRRFSRRPLPHRTT